MSKKRIHRLVDKVERKIDDLTFSRRNDKGVKEGVQIRCYHAYQNDQFAFIQGRVLVKRNFTEAEFNDHLFTNIKRTFKLFYTKEIAGFQLQILIGQDKFEAITDDEGYFEFKIPIQNLASTKSMWKNLFVQSPTSEHKVEKEEVWIQSISDDTEHIIISDIDDTILQSGAHSMLAMIKNTFGKNAKTRLAFEGVDEVYKRLQTGNSDQAVNPIYYLSNSPWNLYDFLVDFMEVNDIPMGTLFLRDWGIDEQKWFKDDGHKLKTIRSLFSQFPEQKFILIGDSGEKDPEYYHEIAKEYPDRVKAIYIRNVTTEEREAEIDILKKDLANISVPFILINNSKEIEDHSTRMNWIT